MKKNIFLSLILALIVFMPSVKADGEYVTYDIMYRDLIPLNELSGSKNNPYIDLYIYNDFETFYKDNKNKQIFDTLYLNMMNYYDENYAENYPYYTMEVIILSTAGDEFKLNSVFLNLHIMHTSDYYNYISATSDTYVDNLYSSYRLGTYTQPYNLSASLDYHSNYNSTFFHLSFSPFFVNPLLGYLPTLSFERNFDWTFQQSTNVYNVYDVISNLILTMEAGDDVPYYREPGLDLSTYETINLNDYAYVLLNLKNYNQVSPFSTDVYVKGQLCLSAGYGFGTTSKTSGVTDSCSGVYDTFTKLNLYILSSDLSNNAIYYLAPYDRTIDNLVKIDTSIFDITYITEENKDNPQITVNGVTYDVIAYDDMESNATKNTDSGIVSGSSCQVGDLNCTSSVVSGGSFSDVISNIGNYFSSVLSGITTFMGFVTQVFNTLPFEFKALSITVFSFGIILGIVKILKG